MKEVIDAFGRALVYCLHPRLMAWSFLPVLLASALAFGLAYLYWEPAVNGVRDLLEQWELLAPFTHWLNGVSGGIFRAVIGPLVVVALSLPVLLIVSMLMVAAFMGQAIVGLVASRRFPALEKRRGTPFWRALLMGVGASALALLALLVSLPFWLILPLALLLPPLIWGWLAFRVMSVDALAEHADLQERQALMKTHRWPLLGMGVVSGYLGMAPSLVWALGALSLPMMPLLAPLYVWMYTLVFAFSALWFTHYCLAALNHMRAHASPAEPVAPPMGVPVALPPPTPSTGP